jgi:hypothetical protein
MLIIMRIYTMLFIGLYFLAFSCEKNELEIIDLAEAFSKQKEIKLSKFVSEIRYIPLELKPESVISEYPTIKVYDYIIVRNSSSKTPLMVFDKSNGKFIKYIGNVGRGPGEYSIPARDFYNFYNKLIYTLDYSHREVKILNIDGKILSNFKSPDIIESSVRGGKLGLSFYTYLDDRTYVSYIDNFTGVIGTKLVIFNRDSIIKTFPNYQRWGENDITRNHRPSFNPQFFRWDNNLYFKEAFNDTVFRVTIDKLIPRIVFKNGKFGLPYEQQQLISPSIDKISGDYFLITDIYEITDFIFFQFSYKKNEYVGFYDKKMKLTTVCKPIGNFSSSIIDDINNFIPLIPIDFTQENEMISVLDPANILKWMKENPGRAEMLKEKMGWLMTVSETSNPVVVIAK